MEKDIVWNVFFENEERFADLINGCGLNGKQMVKPEDLKPADTKNLQYYGTDTKGETGKILDVCKTDKPKKRNGKSGAFSIPFSSSFQIKIRFLCLLFCPASLLQRWADQTG